MTQAFNLSQLANNLNTSGQLDATDGLTGAVPVANGGTGATSASTARTNLGLGTLSTLSPSGTASSSTYLRGDNTWATVSSGGVTSLNGQTGAITNTTFNTIGSYSVAGIISSGLVISAGATYAGSSFRQDTKSAGSSSAFYSFNDNQSNGNQGQTGTWRAMCRSSNTTTDPCSGAINVAPNLWVRIS